MVAKVANAAPLVVHYIGPEVELGMPRLFAEVAKLLPPQLRVQLYMFGACVTPE